MSAAAVLCCVTSWLHSQKSRAIHADENNREANFKLAGKVELKAGRQKDRFLCERRGRVL